MPEINVLSGAAVEPGLLAAADIFRKRTGDRVNIAFATTPEMRRLVAADAAPDVFIAPPSALDEFARLGKVDAAARVTLGRVGVGVVVRDRGDEQAAMRRTLTCRELALTTLDGPLGAMNVPVRAGNSVAADPAFTPLGAPVWLRMDRTEASGLWIAQDTGGAIKGAKIDLYTGHGRGSMRPAMPLNMRTLTIVDAGDFDGCPPAWTTASK